MAAASTPQAESEDLDTILMVDAHDDTRSMLRLWLERCGFAVLEAANGVEALDIAVASAPDLVLTEMWLPGGLDGYELCRRLRENATTRTTPVVAYTTKCMPKDVQRALHAGCDVVLPKPSLPAELEDAITRLLRLAA